MVLMVGRTHDLGALTGLMVAATICTPVSMSLSTMFLCLLANQIGGITPDIDQPTAPFWRNLPVGGIIGSIINKMLGGHRFITHSLLGFAAFGWLARLLLDFLQPIMPHANSGYIWWSFVIGMLSHLLLDTLTKEGVPWLLPIPVKFGFPPVKTLRITTGKKFENFIIMPTIVIINIYLVTTHYQHFLDILKNRIT